MRSLAAALAAAAAVAALAHAGSPAGSLEVRASGLRSDRGKLLALVFTDAAGFPSQPERAVRRQALAIEGGTAIMRFGDLPYGPVAVTLCHDENGNGACDANFLGIPKEGFAFSNGFVPRFSKPSFDDARFEFSERSSSVAITIRY
jgi:uncharacterized protein (DUF2141 family)